MLHRQHVYEPFLQRPHRRKRTPEELPLNTATAPAHAEETHESRKTISRAELAELLNHDLSREYQAIIGYVVYSQVIKGAEYMNIAAELEKHALQELNHAIIIAGQIDYLGGMPAVEAKIVRTSEKAVEMLQFDLDNETETIRNYRERVRQCEDLAEYALGEQIRAILIDEQDHQVALANALGRSVPAPRPS
uniref:Putative Bacterioferritin (Modular protein) n=1 Tax=mine drainage metagenome TaxID=410659 RepID=E6Q095_9ZZZZ